MHQHNSLSAAALKCSHQATTLSDETVVERVKSGNLAAFELLMRRYNQRLFRVARGIVADDHEAEDVVQETYVRAYERLSQFEGRAQFSTWLTRIAVNEAITRRRKTSRFWGQVGSDAIDAVADTRASAMQNNPLEKASLSEIGKLIVTEVDRLPSDLRTVFIMRAVEQLDTRETADCLELSESNVKVRLHRAKALLRERIDQQVAADVRQLYLFDGDRCDRIVAAVFSRLR